MAAPKKSTLLKKARYLIPLIKPFSLGFVAPEEKLLKDLASAKTTSISPTTSPEHEHNSSNPVPAK